MMVSESKALVLAGSASDAELAARWICGDAVICIGALDGDEADDVAARPFDGVVVSGDLADEAWVSNSFALADWILRPGGRLTLLLADTDTTNRDDGMSRRHLVDLPDDVATAWRIVAMAVEHPLTAISFARAAETDGTAASHSGFRHAQVVSRLYRNPKLVPELYCETVSPSRNRKPVRNQRTPLTTLRVWVAGSRSFAARCWEGLRAGIGGSAARHDRRWRPFAPPGRSTGG